MKQNNCSSAKHIGLKPATEWPQAQRAIVRRSVRAHLFAAVRLMPTPPAVVDSMRTYTDGEVLKVSAQTARGASQANHPHNQAHVQAPAIRCLDAGRRRPTQRTRSHTDPGTHTASCFRHPLRKAVLHASEGLGLGFTIFDPQRRWQQRGVCAGGRAPTSFWRSVRLVEPSRRRKLYPAASSMACTRSSMRVLCEKSSTCAGGRG